MSRWTTATRPSAIRIAEHMLEPHLNLFNQITWDEVYRNWQTEDLKYYWKQHADPVVPATQVTVKKALQRPLTWRGVVTGAPVY